MDFVCSIRLLTNRAVISRRKKGYNLLGSYSLKIFGNGRFRSRLLCVCNQFDWPYIVLYFFTFPIYPSIALQKVLQRAHTVQTYTVDSNAIINNHIIYVFERVWEHREDGVILETTRSLYDFASSHTTSSPIQSSLLCYGLLIIFSRSHSSQKCSSLKIFLEITRWCYWTALVRAHNALETAIFWNYASRCHIPWWGSSSCTHIFSTFQPSNRFVSIKILWRTYRMITRHFGCIPSTQLTNSCFVETKSLIIQPYHSVSWEKIGYETDILILSSSVRYYITLAIKPKAQSDSHPLPFWRRKCIHL